MYIYVLTCLYKFFIKLTYLTILDGFPHIVTFFIFHWNLIYLHYS